jgi:hypothetical protein
MFCSTVRPRKMDGSWGRYPMPLRARTYIGSSVMSVPSNNTRPESGAVRPTVM